MKAIRLFFYLALASNAGCNKKVSSHVEGLSPDKEVKANKSLADGEDDNANVATQGDGFFRNDQSLKWRVMMEREHLGFLNSDPIALQAKISSYMREINKQLESVITGETNLELEAIYNQVAKLSSNLGSIETSFRAKISHYLLTEEQIPQTIVLFGDKKSDPQLTARVYNVEIIDATRKLVAFHRGATAKILELIADGELSTEDRNSFADQFTALTASQHGQESSLSDIKGAVVDDFVKAQPWILK